MRALPLLLAFALSAVPSFAVPPGDPLARELARLSKEGFTDVQRADAKVREGLLSALVVRRSDGGGSRLLVYLSGDAKARLLHFEPSLAGIRLSALHVDGTLPDLAGDGSRTIAYVVSFSGLEQDALVLLRYGKGRVERLGKPMPFTDFEDVDVDGNLELVRREKPLGRFFSMDCESFFTMAGKAEKTTILLLKGRRLVDVSARYPAFYRAHMGRLETELASNDPMKTQRFEDYLSTSLALYFDYETLGRRKEGYDRLRKAYKLPRAAPSGIRSCADKMGAELRQKLNVPSDWD
ncbi:MAG: hypothetical protein WC969_09015 [Elusimicrobiota bacterium]|jgi:hypothetical protein